MHAREDRGVPRLAAGAIAGIRNGAAVPEDESTEALSNTVRAAVAVDAAQIVLRGLKARIESLPAAMDSGFGPAAGALLAELHRLESSTTNAARTAKGASEVALLLSDVRRTYNDLMLGASRARVPRRGSDSTPHGIGLTHRRGDRQRRRGDRGRRRRRRSRPAGGRRHLGAPCGANLDARLPLSRWMNTTERPKLPSPQAHSRCQDVSMRSRARWR